MVLPDGAPARVIDLERERGTDLQRALLHHAGMHEDVARLLLGVGDLEANALAGHHTGIADLPARLGVERRLVDDNRAALARLEACDLLAVFAQGSAHAFRALGLVTEELGGAALFAQREPHRFGRGVARARPGRARLFLLALHRSIEAFGVDGDTAGAQRVLRQIEREAVGIV